MGHKADCSAGEIMSQLLTFEEVEDCFPLGAKTMEDGVTGVSAQWLHDFARAIEQAVLAKLGAQEPVAMIGSHGHPKHLSHIPSATEMRLYGPFKPLYAAPPCLTAEVAKLRGELEAAYDSAATTRKRQLDRISELEAELKPAAIPAGMALDAARYRRLRDIDTEVPIGKWLVVYRGPTSDHSLLPDELDAAIDEQIAAAGVKP
jgi:hypothetical protein